MVLVVVEVEQEQFLVYQVPEGGTQPCGDTRDDCGVFGGDIEPKGEIGASAGDEVEEAACEQAHLFWWVAQQRIQSLHTQPEAGMLLHVRPLIEALLTGPEVLQEDEAILEGEVAWEGEGTQFLW